MEKQALFSAVKRWGRVLGALEPRPHVGGAPPPCTVQGRNLQ